VNLKIWRRTFDNLAEKKYTVINSIFYGASENGIKVCNGAAIDVYNSVIYGSGNQGIWVLDNPCDVGPAVVNSHVVNCIIMSNGPGHANSWGTAITVSPQTTGKNISTLDADHNLYFGNAFHNVGLNSDTNFITENPLFVNPAIGDFRLQNENSPAIDAGADLSSSGIADVAMDINGNPRPGDGTAGYDIGAYEYMQPTATQYTITASAETSGEISPSGEVVLNEKANQTFRITPNYGYHIQDVLIDGASVGAVPTYTFTGITANHTISVSFAKNIYSVTVNNGTGSGNYEYGAVVAIQANEPPANYHFIQWTGDVSGVADITSPSTTLTVNRKSTVTANNEIDSNIITATAGTGGTISPSGSIEVNYRASQRFIISPDKGYRVAEVLVDGISVGAVPSYTLSDVVDNHAISASFAIDSSTITITAIADSGGTITPSGFVKVNEGADQTFTITTDSGYYVENVVVDGRSQGAITSYTFTNASANHTIEITTMQGNVWYADQNNAGASDSNSGTEAAPFKTIQKGVSAAQPGDMVLIKGSIDPDSPQAVYNVIGNGITTVRPGTPGKLITIAGYPGHKVIIQGNNKDSGIHLDRSSYHVFRGLVFRNFARGVYGYALKTNLLIEKCEFSQMTEWGMWLRDPPNLTLRDVYVHHSAYGIFVVQEAVYCDNIFFERVEGSYNNVGSPDGIACNISGAARFVDCIANNNTDGFDITANATLVNCVAHDNLYVNLKLWRRGFDNLAEKTYTVINSIFYNTGEDAICVANGARLNLYNSILYGGVDSGVRICGNTQKPGPPVVTSTLVNNIFANNGTAIAVQQAGPNLNSGEADHNLYFNNKRANTGLKTDTNFIANQDPLFIAPANGDFHLQNGNSPAVDSGADLSSHGVTKDFGSTPRPQDGNGDGTAVYDIGAYEYVEGALPVVGDVNGDTRVDSLDVQACVNHILGTQDWSTRADVNKDSAINALDVQRIVNIILGV
jgi:hypothetical protein